MLKFKGYTIDGDLVLTGILKIVDSVKLMMSTSQGTRVYDYAFGSKLEDLLFESIDDRMIPEIISQLEDIFDRERRMRLINDTVRINKNIDNCSIELFFSLLYVNTKINFIYYRDLEN
ncbi:MAG: hypothetical protein ACRC0R_06510 [Cetobacterium sp.]